MGSFLEDTAPRPDARATDRFRGHVGEDWSVVFAFGGTTAAAALRAMGAVLERPDLRMTGVHVQFASPVPPGAMTIQAEVLRSGRSVAQVAGRLWAEEAEEPALRVSGTWAAPRTDDPVVGRGVEPPSVPSVGDPRLERLVHEPPWDRFPLHRKFEEWRCPGFGVASSLFLDGERPESAVWVRTTDPCRSDGQFEPSVLALIADRVPGPLLGPCLRPIRSEDVSSRPLVSLELALRVFAEPVSDWVLVHGRVDHAADGHVVTSANLWDEARSLIATSEQLARFATSAVGD